MKPGSGSPKPAGMRWRSACLVVALAGGGPLLVLWLLSGLVPRYAVPIWEFVVVNTSGERARVQPIGVWTNEGIGPAPLVRYDPWPYATLSGSVFSAGDRTHRARRLGSGETTRYVINDDCDFWVEAVLIQGDSGPLRVHETPGGWAQPYIPPLADLPEASEALAACMKGKLAPQSTPYCTPEEPAQTNEGER